MTKSLKILFFVFLLAGCGGDDGINIEDKSNSESYSYDYTFNGCKTGKHSFSNKKDYCNGLADEGRNNGCAGQLRCGAFLENGCEEITGLTCQ